MRKQQTTELALLCICFPRTTESSATGTGSGCVCVGFGITHGSDLGFIGVIIKAEYSSEEVGCGLPVFHVAVWNVKLIKAALRNGCMDIFWIANNIFLCCSSVTYILPRLRRHVAESVWIHSYSMWIIARKPDVHSHTDEPLKHSSQLQCRHNIAWWTPRWHWRDWRSPVP